MENKVINFLEKELEDGKKRVEAIANRLKLLNSLPDDEWDLVGNPENGQKAKKNTIEALIYEKGFAISEMDTLEHVITLLRMSTTDFDLYVESIEEVRNSRKEMITHLTNPDYLTSRPHMEFCELHGTNEPWAVSEKCSCPGAYIIRKRISEGMTFEEAIKYVIDNELL